MSSLSYIERVSFEKRVEETTKQRSNHDDRVPVVVESEPNMPLLLRRTKFVVPKDQTIAQFMFALRKYLVRPMDAQQGLVLFPLQVVRDEPIVDAALNRVETRVRELAPMTSRMGDLDASYRHRDGMLYCRLMLEKVFG
jgi:hypothetical protein